MRTTRHRPSNGMPLVTHQALDISNQTGTLAIITGAHSGIGCACRSATGGSWAVSILAVMDPSSFVCFPLYSL
jgi:hypothetical protein